MSRKPNLAEDMDELAERTDQNLLSLLDHARRDDQENQAEPPREEMKEPEAPEAPDGVEEPEELAASAPRQSSQRRKKAPVKAAEPSDVPRTLTTQLLSSTIKRLKRATSHQHLNELEPDTIQGIVQQAIEEWCDKRNYS